MNKLKIAATSLTMATIALTAGAQNLSREQYIEKFAPTAIAHAEKYGIPASIKMAQGILESAYGNGRLAREANTHFNIKVKPSDNWRGAVIYHDDDRPGEAFRAYRTAEESWIDHSEYLDRQPRYDSLFRYGTTDYRSWARGLKNAGYATDPLYAEKLIRVVEENELWRLDGTESASGTAGTVIARNDRNHGHGSHDANTPPPAAGLIDVDRFVVTIRRDDDM